MTLLERCAQDDSLLNEKLEELKISKNNAEQLKKICSPFVEGGDRDLGVVTKRLAAIKSICKKIESSQEIEQQDKEYYLKIFNLFKYDHSACKHCLNKKWKKARDDYKYLVDNGDGVLSYYSSKGWIEDYLDYSNIMIMIQDGKSRDDIVKTSEYKNILKMSKALRSNIDNDFPEGAAFMNVPPFEKVTI